MPVQPQLVLLQKTLLYVEGLGRQLYPELDLWQTAKPYLENWMKERMSPSTLIEEIKRRAPFWREKLPEIPDLVYQALKSDNKKQRLLEEQVSILKQQVQKQERQHKRNIYAISGAVCIISSVLLNTNSVTSNYLDTILLISGITFLLLSFRKT